MDYGLPKTLPATGVGGFIALSMGEQIIFVIALMAAVFIAVTALRALWRRGKTVSEG